MILYNWVCNSYPRKGGFYKPSKTNFSRIKDALCILFISYWCIFRADSEILPSLPFGVSLKDGCWSKIRDGETESRVRQTVSSTFFIHHVTTSLWTTLGTFEEFILFVCFSLLPSWWKLQFFYFINLSSTNSSIRLYHRRLKESCKGR